MPQTAPPVEKSARAIACLWLAWALLLLAFDQISKQWIVRNYHLGEWTAVSGFFNIVRAHNSGAAFSFLATAGGWQHGLFIGIGVLACAFIVWQLLRHPQRRLYALALASILGGAAGNVLDRLQYGYVVDFLDFYWGRWHFPAFNVADSAISLGVACLLLDEWLRPRQAAPAPDQAPGGA